VNTLIAMLHSLVLRCIIVVIAGVMIVVVDIVSHAMLAVYVYLIINYRA
jgi:hypothetical protein